MFLHGSNGKQLLIGSDWLNCVSDPSYSACPAEARRSPRIAGAQPGCCDRGQGHRSSRAKQRSLVSNLYKLSYFHGEANWDILSWTR